MRTTGVPAEAAPFLGLPFNLLDEAAASEAVLALRRQEAFSYLVTPNVDHMVRLLRNEGDRRLWAAYTTAALRLCDSRVLKALAARSGVRLSVVTGSNLTAIVLDSLSFLDTAAVIGGNEDLLLGLKTRYPKLTWFHHEAPRGILHNPQAQLDVACFVESCQASLFFFAMGSPQSELICALIAQRAKGAGVGLCIGASLEFLTGAKARAPRWMQKAGLEWFFRLSNEPARLWKRYLVEGPLIFWYWATWRIKAFR